MGTVSGKILRVCGEVRQILCRRSLLFNIVLPLPKPLFQFK